MSWTEPRLVAMAAAIAGLLLATVAEVQPTAALVSALPGIALTVASRGQAARTAGIAAAAACIGIGLGVARVDAIDSGALIDRPGKRLHLRGHVASVPREAGGRVRVRVHTPRGRVEVDAVGRAEDLRVGREVAVAGRLVPPSPARAAMLRRNGAAMVLKGERLRLTGARRGGLSGAVDRVRDRAEASLARAMPPREKALVAGMVLGQDDRIDAGTIDDFKRSGLAHLLAVSGQNIMLLAALAMPLLGLAGVPLRARLWSVLALIAIYVPLTGAGAPIQRAGIMGAAGVIAAMAGRPRVRWYAVLIAALGTLALNPRAGSDVGWQLSFAAVGGILLWSRPLAVALARRLGGGHWQRGLAEGAAMTISATVATAPLMAHHFEAFSISSLVANLLALPAVAPLMWLGMLASFIGQFPATGALLDVINPFTAVLGAFIAQVARWLGPPSWAMVPVGMPAGLVAAVYAATVAAWWIARGVGGRRRGLSRASRRRRSGRVVIAAAATAVLLVAGSLVPGGSDDGRASRPDLIVRVIDVGQGDAILLDPRGADPVLIDTGPPGARISDKLRSLGVRRLAAVAITHDELDHSGALPAVLATARPAQLLHADAKRQTLSHAAAAGARSVRLAAGDVVRAGALRLEVVWPEPGTEPVEGASPNDRSLVIIARHREFSMLLTGDAEAEAVPLNPGPIDVLKVSHHGSRDEGLPSLLDTSSPALAVISSGRRNRFGHPSPEVLGELARRTIPTMRTDTHGTVTISVAAGSWSATRE